MFANYSNETGFLLCQKTLQSRKYMSEMIPWFDKCTCMIISTEEFLIEVERFIDLLIRKLIGNCFDSRFIA